MTPGPDSPLIKYLAARRPALAETLMTLLRERIPFYRDIPDDALLRSTTAFIDAFVESLRSGDLERVLAMGRANLEARYSQVTLEEVFHLTSALRGTLFAALAPVQKESDEIFALLAAAEPIYDALNGAAARLYAEKLEAARAREREMRAISTPLIPVGEGVVVMPLVGEIDDARAEQMQEALLQGAASHRARAAILDVTGVPGVDARVAAALLRAAQASRLLGAEVIFTGIQPEAARTFVAVGADFCGVMTKATLRDGIAWALGHDRRA
ncbi:MAG: STAS domain-containing protein [Polyangiaceae bacterium]|nr:STAS domain-containing protein [Polyangiaceae bacterium]